MPYNSTIKTKRGRCLDCPESAGEKSIIAKRCLYHYKIYRAVLQKRTRVKNPRDQTVLFKQNLDLWFDDRIRELSLKPFCMECKANIPVGFYRHAVAHIFPKSVFNSVSTHRWNYIFLGAGCGCHDKTHRIDTFSKMKIFPLAVVRFRQFEDEITERHKYKSLFIEEADKLLIEL